MSAEKFLPGTPVSCDDRFSSLTVPATTESTVLALRTKVGVRCFVVGICTVAGSVSDIVWNLRADGAKVFPYADFQISPSDPTLWKYLPFPIEVGQNCEISLTASNTSASSVDCDARLIIFYVES